MIYRGVTRVLAISDLHVNHAANWHALAALPEHREDWLILAGDIGERVAHHEATIELLRPKFRGVVWVPGNHDLWRHSEDGRLAAPAKYRRLVEVYRSHGAVTPEDEYPLVDVDGTHYRLAPLFVLYDYSFRPAHLRSTADAVEWAAESGVVCADETMISPAPFASREAWCHERVTYTRGRLDEQTDEPLVLINHFPLREDLAILPAIPRFQLWCGTTLTEQWHTRYRVAAVVYGHLHLRATRWRDGVRFEEVSLGRPTEWAVERGAAEYLREILPGATAGVVDTRHP